MAVRQQNIVLLCVFILAVATINQRNVPALTTLYWEAPETAKETSQKEPPSPSRRPKIAILSGFVPSRGTNNQVSTKLHHHMLNKACYADQWGYDYFYNTTWGFDDGDVPFWQDHGTWHRVPHMQAILPKYDWIVYADTDWVVQVSATKSVYRKFG